MLTNILCILFIYTFRRKLGSLYSWSEPLPLWRRYVLAKTASYALVLGVIGMATLLVVGTIYGAEAGPTTGTVGLRGRDLYVAFLTFFAFWSLSQAGRSVIELCRPSATGGA